VGRGPRGTAALLSFITLERKCYRFGDVDASSIAKIASNASRQLSGFWGSAKFTPCSGGRTTRGQRALGDYALRFEEAPERTKRPKRNTSKRHPEHKVYPYLLRGKTIHQPNQVWAADVTYIPMLHGFLYVVAIIDWATRRVLSWRLSNTLTAGFCVAALSAALARFGKPGIFNTDQGTRNSPAASLPRCCGITGSRLSWMDAGAATTISLSSACGGP
jgi:hypothetical protein